MKIFIPLLLLILSASCGNRKDSKNAGPEGIVELELVDSLVVDELSTLAMDDYNPQTGYYLIKGTRTRKLYLVDSQGTIIQEYDVLNDSPNGLGANGALGYRFLGKDRWVAHSPFSGFHIYSLQGEKLKTVPPNTPGLFRITIYSMRTTFTPYLEDGVAYVIGEEPNAFDPSEHDPNAGDASFYENVRTVYRYNLDTEENELLETFPKEWQPRQTKTYVGASLPFLAFDPRNKELAVLPVRGNQLFVYDYSDSIPVLKHEVELSHRFRPKAPPAFDPNDDPNLSEYPEFTDLRILGDYLLVGFHTRIPATVLRELRAKAEQFYRLPEYKAASKQYSKPYYLLVKDGKQVGILDEFPVSGTLNFTDADGILYVNDNSSPEVERDYNVFYKLRIKNRRKKPAETQSRLPMFQPDYLLKAVLKRKTALNLQFYYPGMLPRFYKHPGWADFPGRRYSI